MLIHWPWGGECRNGEKCSYTQLETWRMPRFSKSVAPVSEARQKKQYLVYFEIIFWINFPHQYHSKNDKKILQNSSFLEKNSSSSWHCKNFSLLAELYIYHGWESCAIPHYTEDAFTFKFCIFSSQQQKRRKECACCIIGSRYSPLLSLYSPIKNRVKNELCPALCPPSESVRFTK